MQVGNGSASWVHECELGMEMVSRNANIQRECELGVATIGGQCDNTHDSYLHNLDVGGHGHQRRHANLLIKSPLQVGNQPWLFEANQPNTRYNAKSKRLGPQHLEITLLSWHFPPMRDFELQWSRALKLYCKQLLIGLYCKHIEVLDAWI